MTKREVLIAICENPGWQPSEPGPALCVALDQLVSEGWVVQRLDNGYEVTDKALDEYPTFESQEDIANPESIRAIKDESGEKFDASQEKALPSIVIRDRQRVEAHIDFGVIQGTVVISNECKHPDRREVTITINSKLA